MGQEDEVGKDEVLKLLHGLFESMTTHLFMCKDQYPTKELWAEYVREQASYADTNTLTQCIEDDGVAPDDEFFEATKNITTIIIDESWNIVNSLGSSKD